MHILVIDDSEAQFTLIQHLLSVLRQDVQFTFAPTYQQGLQIATSHHFDVMLIDYDLGGGNGLELIQTLQKLDINTPMILMTGHGNRAIDLQAMESGAVDYLDKQDIRATSLERSIRYAIRYGESLRFAEAMLDTSIAINSTLDLDQVLERILDNLRHVIPHDIASITLIEEGFNRVVGYVGTQYEHEIRKMRLEVNNNPEMQWMIHHQSPLLLSVIDDDHHPAMFDRIPNIKSYLASPLIIGDQVAGFIHLFSRTAGFFTDDYSSRLQIFANQAASAVRNAQAYEQAQEVAALEERQRLAQDLHDAVSQTLFSASVIAESLSRMMHDEAELQQGLHRLARMNKGALAEMRTLLLELRPSAILDTEISILLQHLANAARSHTDAQIELSIHAERVLLPNDVKIGFYRITQEALNNIIKHARAQTVQIMTEDHEHYFSLTIQDDGIGFDVDNVPSDHMGLRIIRERALNLDLQIEITSVPNTGTRIYVFYPKGVHDD